MFSCMLANKIGKVLGYKKLGLQKPVWAGLKKKKRWCGSNGSADGHILVAKQGLQVDEWADNREKENIVEAVYRISIRRNESQMSAFECINSTLCMCFFTWKQKQNSDLED